ncbi:MAG TPA: hypothetical protein VL084_15580 [Thermoanaerobaculia bacterium]|nr:hypothetical protein [Thermoanaerobaculia bacterium]
MFGPLPLVLALSTTALTPAPREAADGVRRAEAAHRLAEAAARFEAGDFAGEYLRTTRTQVLSLSGAVLGEEVETVRVRMRDRWQTIELVRAVEGGKDVTEERKRTFSPVPAGAEPDVPSPLSPKGTGLSFSPLPLPKGQCGASFAPVPKGAAGSEGRLAWDCATLTPLWAELTPSDAPTELSEPRVRLEFARAGELLYARRYTLEGLAADGPKTVRMRLVLEISDLKPAG